MLTNDIKKGAKLVLTGGRCATMYDNAKGIIRMVKTDDTNGYYEEIGSVYADEIVGVVAEKAEPGKQLLICMSVGKMVDPAELAPAHKKKLAGIRAVLP
jgi:hypothetical protein